MITEGAFFWQNRISSTNQILNPSVFFDKIYYADWAVRVARKSAGLKNVFNSYVLVAFTFT